MSNHTNPNLLPPPRVTRVPLPTLPAHPTCTLCPLSSSAKHPGIPTTHLSYSLPPQPPNKPLVIIGQYPGLDEDSCGLPFIGKTGRFLDNVIITPTSYHTRFSIFLTQTVRCYTPNDPTPGNYKTCSSNHLLPDLNAISTLCGQPGVILTLGAPAFRSLTSLPLSSRHQQPFPYHSWLVYATFHPSALSYNPSLETPFLLDLSHINDLLSSTPYTPPPLRLIPPAGPPARSPHDSQEEA